MWFLRCGFDKVASGDDDDSITLALRLRLSIQSDSNNYSCSCTANKTNPSVPYLGWVYLEATKKSVGIRLKCTSIEILVQLLLSFSLVLLQNAQNLLETGKTRFPQWRILHRTPLLVSQRTILFLTSHLLMMSTRSDCEIEDFLIAWHNWWALIYFVIL